MTQSWRLLLHGARSAFDNMAIDEAILRCVVAGDSPNTLRFYTWEPSAVSVGYFQGLEQEVDLEACEREGVDVIRRLTGGGAVFHDRDGEITYSLALKGNTPGDTPGDTPGIPQNVLESYGVLCRGLVLGLQYLGLKANFAPINDILVNGRKISGNAQTRRFGGILQHGTVLCDVNPVLMFQLLKVPDAKMRDKLIQAVTERVTSIRRELGEVEHSVVLQALQAGFAEALAVDLVPGVLSLQEETLAQQIKAERYATHEWLFKR